jgi:hypothetical protein
LVLISDEELPDLSHLESLEISCEYQGDGRWRTCVWLKKDELQALFGAFVDDLISSSRALPKREVGKFTIARIARWRRLFELGSSNMMPLSELRGLVGELAVLLDAFTRYSPGDAVQAWCGPLDAPQDFAFADVKIEVKTVGPTALRARITSVDQLDVPVEQNLLLAVVSLAAAATDDVMGFGITQYISDIRLRLLNYPHEADEFESRLRAAGYDDHPDYATVRFRLDGIRYFDVTKGFPRLIRGNLMHGIADASYEIELSALSQYQRLLGPQ